MSNTMVVARVVRRRCAGRLSGRRRGWLRRPRPVTGLLAAMVGTLIAAASTAAATAGEPVQAPPVISTANYVALGDSYSSGVGTGVDDPASGTCARSALSYPPLWADEHHPVDVRFVACSGATTGDVRANQIAAVGPGTDLITLTIGGNDAGYGSVLRTCTLAADDNMCLAAVDTAEDFARSQLPTRLTGVYTAIRGAAPRARVIVLGYPRLFDLAPSCIDPWAPDLARRHKLNEGADVLNDVINSAIVSQPGFGFIDVRGQFNGHGVCAADPWITGPSFVKPYHPTQHGYRDGYLAALDAASSVGAVAAP
jgi:lysophospholipase L1-like esterase